MGTIEIGPAGDDADSAWDTLIRGESEELESAIDEHITADLARLRLELARVFDAWRERLAHS